MAADPAPPPAAAPAAPDSSAGSASTPSAPCALSAAAGAPEVLLVVAGAHLRGQPLNPQLLALDARFVAATRTAAAYRMFALDTVPAKPGVVRVPGGGAALAVEVWALGAAAFGTFVAGLPAPMAIGKVELADGRELPGFLVEPCALGQAEDITVHGGWTAYREAVV